MKQPPASAQHACQLIVEDLRIQLASNAEAWWVMQDGIDRIVGQRGDVLCDIGMGQLQAAAGSGALRIRRPRVERAQPQHIGILSNESSCAAPASRQQAAK